MNHRVLIVDDSRVSRMMIRAYMTQYQPNWEYVEASNGAEAIDFCQKAPFDLVTMDVNMSGMSGIDAGSEIKRIHPETRVVMVTANIQSAMRGRATQAGLEFMEKPVTDQMIAQLLDCADQGH